MNKKGSLGIAIISSIIFFIIGMATINLLIPEVTDFRTNMDCSNAEAISDGTKLTCLMGGISIPYWILIIFTIAIGGIIARLTF